MSLVARRVGVCACAVAAAAALAACGSSGGGAVGATDAATARAPRVVMTGPTTGVAVWPSGVRWVVLGTTDGWRTVTNRTPVAVPTDGGLVLAATASRVAVGVLPHELLTVSPVLQSVGGGRTWAPSQLPSALLPTSDSLARSSRATWAVLADTSVVTRPDASVGWHPMTSSRALDSTGRFRATGVAFPDGATGFVFGTTASAGPVLFTSGDSGRTWSAVGLGDGSGAATALAPCRIGRIWAAPVLTDGRLAVWTASRPSGPWTAGAALAAGATPAVGCGPTGIWAAVAGGSGSRLVVATPGGAWTDEGRVAGHVVSIAPVSATAAFAAVAGPARLVSLHLGASPMLTRVPLPSWVSTVGGPAMRN